MRTGGLQKQRSGSRKERHTIVCRFGSRHGAALGINEETDAVAVVVSEETGGVSVASDGKMTEELGKDELRRLLLNLFKELTAPAPRLKKKKSSPAE